MASNRYALLILITALCFTAPASLWAQSSGYFMELRFVQRLTWVGDEYATRYEVIIEKEEDGKYKRAYREFTTAFFIEVSLSPGKYRYQVIPYDFFNHPVPVTEWMNFEVQRGIAQNQLNNYVPGEHEIIIINPDEPESRKTVNITGSKPANPDLIILKDGNVIEAKVMDKHSSEIRYKRFDNPDGRLLSIPLDNVLSIRYEDGTVEIIIIEPKEITIKREIYALDPDRPTFGLSIDPVGLVFNGGALIFEFTKGKSNFQINLLTPGIGLASFRGSDMAGWVWPTNNWFGIGLCFGSFHPSRLGGFYLGVDIEYSFGELNFYDQSQYFLNSLAFALNIGYKFITKSGIYFRTGATVGVSADGIGGEKTGISLVLRPDLTIGFYFKKKNLVIEK
jgi:hypothetical protein